MKLPQKYRKEFQIIIDDDMFNYKKMQYWNCEFDSSKLNKLTLDSNNKLKLMTTSGCSKDKKAISLEKIPQGGQVYWEIIKSHTHGCYDSIGVCTKYVQRNGTTAYGWAVRCYGAHSDFEFTGAWHNNIKTKFYEKWTTNSRIGLLYNSQTKSLSFFDNQIYVGTPFTNIEGEQLYFLVEGCHLGSFEIIHDAELPSDIEIEKIESKSQPIY